MDGMRAAALARVREGTASRYWHTQFCERLPSCALEIWAVTHALQSPGAMPIALITFAYGDLYQQTMAPIVQQHFDMAVANAAAELASPAIAQGSGLLDVLKVNTPERSAVVAYLLSNTPPTMPYCKWFTLSAASTYRSDQFVPTHLQHVATTEAEALAVATVLPAGPERLAAVGLLWHLRHRDELFKMAWTLFPSQGMPPTSPQPIKERVAAAVADKLKRAVSTADVQDPIESPANRYGMYGVSEAAGGKFRCAVTIDKRTNRYIAVETAREAGMIAATDRHLRSIAARSV